MIRKNQSITLEVQAAWWKEKERKRENVPMGLLGLDQSPGDARMAPFFEGFPRLNVRKFVTEGYANASPVRLLGRSLTGTSHITWSKWSGFIYRARI